MAIRRSHLALGISPHTTVAHSSWVYDKLGVSNRTELVQKLLVP
jgi:DNA-binding CsgD family transcriptional regulator